MGTYDLASGINGGYHPTQIVTAKMPYLVTKTFTWAAAKAAKGSDLAAADVINAIDVPAGTAILAATIKKVDAPTGTVSVATLDLGTGVDTDNFVDGWDYYAATAGDWAQAPAAYQPFYNTAADTIDVVIATLTGTLLTGSVTVSALLCDLEGINAPGIVALRS
jgi:hypothetical protein